MAEKIYAEHDNASNIDESCAIVRSDLCYWLSGKMGCPRCYIHTLKNDDQKKDAQQRWQETISMLPGTFDNLHESEECQFCKDEPRKADGYAVFEMANPEPYFEKGMFFGIGKKVRTPVGSLVTVQASVCPRCRKAFRMADLIQIFSLVIGVAVGIILVMIPAISQKFTGDGLLMLLPLVIIALAGVAGYFIGKNASMASLRKNAKTVKLDLSEIPAVSMMLNKNWFFFQTSGGIPRVSFSRQKQFDRVLRPKKTPMEPDEGQKDDDIPLDNMNI